MAVITKNTAVNLDKILENLEKVRKRNKIFRVGIELEGGWKSLPEGTNLVRDGSVIIEPAEGPEAPRGLDNDGLTPIVPERVYVTTNDIVRNRFAPEDLRMDGPVGRYYLADPMLYMQEGRVTVRPPNVGRRRPPSLKTGELPSEPLEPAKVPIWMKKYYPSVVNETCGLHVHMSFKSALHYQRLMVPEFQLTIVNYVKKWANDEKLPKEHPIWERLSGKSRYCQHKFFADQQAQMRQKDYDQARPGHRYTVINYCFNHHGTAECRLLPMMETADQGIRAVQNVLDITNAFLHVTAAREERVRAEVEVDSADTYREVRVVNV